MTTSRRPRVAAEPSARGFTALLAAAAALGVACNAPERLFEEASSSAASGSGSDAASSVSASGSGGASSATGVGGSSSSSEASSSSGSSLPCVGDGGPCDCDGDGEQSWQCDGGDCADYDSRANTKADFVLTDQPIQGPKKEGTLPFDFNCNGSVEGQILPLPDCVGLGLSNCQGGGYLPPVPACGGQANLGHCKKGLLSCEAVVDNIAKSQGCR